MPRSLPLMDANSDNPLEASIARSRKERTRPLLTTDDLNAALNDERHLGFGYATRRHLDDAELEARIDAAVIAEANAKQMTREQLFDWANSKNGRWLVDMCSGGTVDAVIVRKLVQKP